MSGNIKKTLHVSWHMTSPPLPAERWHLWNRKSFPAVVTDEHSGSIFGERVQGVLLKALELSLDRYTGWEAGEDLSPEEKKATAEAAGIYKRGVAWRAAGQEVQPELQQNGTYPITIHAPGKATPELQELSGPETFVITDQHVLRCWPELSKYCDYSFKARETEKNPDTVGSLMLALEQKPATRRLLITGGGITGDVAAFAASRAGLPFTLVPTTLLAMADACVGGKTGVNAPPWGKNLIGAFAFPEQVLVFPEFLETLSPRDFSSGASECIKHLLLDKKLPHQEALATALRKRDSRALLPFLPEIIGLKARVVAEDPAEKGRRASLNLGHTLAHGLEALSHRRVSPEDILLHGEAVAAGLYFAVLLSAKAGYLPEAEKNSMLTLIGDAGILPGKKDLLTRLGHPDPAKLWEELWPYIRNDKKSAGGNPGDSRWILLKGQGQVVQPEPGHFTTPVPHQVISDTWKQFLAGYPV